MDNCIRIKGARANNLKNIDVEIPRDKLVVITGLSGSGKSSLAFDTLYAEGQRRYVESLNAYARQFLGRMHKPECDYIHGIPPAIAIEQKVVSRNPRSTVGTSTEIYEYLRLLYARIGRTISPISGQEVRKHTTEDVVQCMLRHAEGERFMVVCPIVVPEGRTLEQTLRAKVQAGYSRMMTPPLPSPTGEGDFKSVFPAEVMLIEDYLAQTNNNTPSPFEGNRKSGVSDWGACDGGQGRGEGPGEGRGGACIVIDRLSARNDKDTIARLVDSAEIAFYEGGGEMSLYWMKDGATDAFSVRFEADGIKFEEPTDNLFAFNSPYGACPECEGFGRIIGIDEKLVIPNTSLSVYDGAVMCWRGEKLGEWRTWFIRTNSERGFPIFKPYFELTQEEKDWLWHGTIPASVPADKRKLTPEEREWGVVSIDAFFADLQAHQYKIQNRVMLARYRGKTTCTKCRGSRLRPEASYVKVCGKSITELVEMPISELLVWFNALTLTEHEQQVSARLLKEIRSRLQFLVDVGLPYLTLGRTSNTLSGGESQRINLATSLGSSLVGSLYILDEPSIGLHSRDTQRLIGVLKQLRDLGNTVVVVEHDEDIIRQADYIIDIGPEAGRLGGEVVWEGTPSISPFRGEHERSDFPLKGGLREASSHSLEFLSGQDVMPVPSSRRPWNSYVEVKGARANNLKGIDVRFPLHVLTCVTGVSGSGKSSLVRDIFFNGMRRQLDIATDIPGEHLAMEGDMKSVRGIEFVDQNPIGKSSRSNPVTYVKAWDEIRKLFAGQALAKQMGYTAGHFSFNTDGGRCEECKGDGTITVEMQFMADLVLECESCHGKRFKQEILDVRYEGQNVFEVLNMTVNQAIEFFGQHKATKVVKLLKPLQDVGLGYIKLGQSSSTLSGGENQRVKLAYYLGLEKKEHTLFIFDEPTTGLHFHDIKKLMAAFDALIAKGHTIVVIEHNLEVIKCADHVIDLGPEGGDQGGQLVCCGTPEQVARCPESYTGRFLSEKIHN